MLLVIILHDVLPMMYWNKAIVSVSREADTDTGRVIYIVCVHNKKLLTVDVCVHRYVHVYTSNRRFH